MGYTILKMVDGYKIEGLYQIDTTKDYGNDSVLKSIDYVYNEKYNNFEKEIYINGTKIKWLETKEYDNYRLEKVLLYNV